MSTYSLENGVLRFEEGLEIILPESFVERLDITRIEIPSSVRELGAAAFAGCENLKEVIFLGENNITEIGDGAFTLCHRLDTFSFGEKLKTIGEMAFWETALRSVVLPMSVESIGESCFWGCPYLKSFTALNPDCQIAMDVLSDCPMLTDGFVAAGYPSGYHHYNNTMDELSYTLLYFSHREGHKEETKLHAEQVAKDREILLIEKIVANNNTSAMTGLMEAGLINEDNVDQYLAQAGKENRNEVVNLLLETKRNTHKTMDFGDMEL